MTNYCPICYFGYRKVHQVVCWKEDGTSCSTLHCRVELTSPMKRQMEQLVEVGFADVFKDSPGSADIVEHDIRAITN